VRVKKVLLFVALFVAGMALLRFFQGPGPQGADAAPPAQEPWVETDPSDALGLTPGGKLEVRRFLEGGEDGRRPTDFVLDAEDSGESDEGGELFLSGVTVLYLDPATKATRMELKAARATARRAESSEEFELKLGDELRLEDVRVTLNEGAPIVPVTVSVPVLFVDLAAGTLSSDEPVTLAGVGLSGGGMGLFFDEQAGFLRIPRDGDLRVAHGAETARLRSKGPLLIERGTEDPLALLLSAEGGAHLLPSLSPGGEHPETPQGLRAERIVLRGREVAPGEVELQVLDAEGGATYRRGPHELAGESLHVELDLQGEPARAEVHGNAHARLVVEPDEGEEASGERSATVSSEDIVLEWLSDGVHVTAAGVAVLRGEGVELTSDGPITGVVSRDGQRANFHSSEGVRLSVRPEALPDARPELVADAVLVTREVEVTLERDAAGQAVMLAEARGRPLVSGTTADGRPFSVRSEGALSLRQAGKSWTLPSAERVEVTVLEGDSFRARADQVEDFDPRAFSLVARGRVEVETAEGLATGEELTVAGRDHFTLTGTPERKATFESADGHAEALLVERMGERVALRGDVAATLQPSLGGGEAYDLACDELTVVRSTVEGADGGLARTFELDASGLRRALMESPDGTLEVECKHLHGTFEETLDAAGAQLASASTLKAEEVARAIVVRPGERPLRTRLSCAELEATRHESLGADGELTVTGEAVARGEVVFSGSLGDVPFTGLAHEVAVDQAGSLRASAEGEGTVFFSGLLPSNSQPFEMEARWIEATEERIEAYLPVVDVHSMQTGVPGEADVDLHASAKHMTSTETWLEFEEEVHVDGITGEKIPWTLDAGKVRFEGHVSPAESTERSEVTALVASQGVVLSLPDRGMRATGETLRAARLTGLMRFEGVPAKFESEALVHEAEWIEVDINLGALMGSGKGRVRPPPEEDSAQEEGGTIQKGSWTIDYLSLQTLVEPDSLITVLQEPKVTYEGEKLAVFLPVLPSTTVSVSASWAVLWVDREEWGKLSGRLGDDEEDAEEGDEQGPPAPEATPAEAPAEATPQGKPRGREPRFFDRIREFGVLHEVYLEGPVEVQIGGQPSAYASAVYLDMVSGNGWLADASFTLDGDLFGFDFKKVKVQARWLRQSRDTSFYADEATVSLCEFDKPHMLIRTGDLRITRESEKENFSVRLRDNSIRVYDLFNLPLPSIDYSSDEKGKPILSTVQLGSSARFGSFVSAGFARPATGAAKFFGNLLGRPDMDVDMDVDAEYSVDASWLGSRGVLLDLGFLVEAKDQFRLLTEIGGVPDNDDDKGYIRVPEDDRPGLRTWLRMNGRYWFDEDEWIDLVGTMQSDAGVQSEFFESEFEKYERQETYLRWRKARELHYYSATLKVPTDDFFSSVDELPSLRLWRGRGELVSLGPTSLVYSADASAAYLERRESDGGYASPFGLPAVFPDGFGDREVMRFDTTQRLEAPFGLGFGGLRATPFALARFSAWDEDTLEDDEPVRALGQAGVRVSAAFWKRAAGGGVHQLAPYVELRNEVALEENGGVPVVFDEVELPVGGDYLDVGVRGRLAARAEGAAELDFDLRASHVTGVEGGPADGWYELGTFSRLSIEPYSTPMQLFHDGRYDAETGDTLYSRLTLGVKATEALHLEASHLRGLDLDREALFEAATLAGLYTWTEKWEFEASRTFSLLEGDRLDSAFLLRRYGHDIVFEIETSFREGEGASLGISVKPLAGFDRPEVGSVSF
jgi:hypothetical protein